MSNADEAVLQIPSNALAASGPINPIEAGLMTPPPIHIMSALLTMTLDRLWSGPLPEFIQKIPSDWSARTYWEASLILLIALLTFFVTWGIQRYLANDGNNQAMIKAVVLAIIVATPEYTTSGVIGTIFMAWAGLSQVRLNNMPFMQK
jgi:hypothetical protein